MTTRDSSLVSWAFIKTQFKRHKAASTEPKSYKIISLNDAKCYTCFLPSNLAAFRESKKGEDAKNNKSDEQKRHKYDKNEYVSSDKKKI